MLQYGSELVTDAAGIEKVSAGEVEPIVNSKATVEVSTESVAY
jgi:hypothetical protein